MKISEIKEKLKSQKIETPSWGYSNSGTRFKVFKQEGAAQNIYQRIDDAAEVHKLTGITPSIAIHIPWDIVDNWKELSKYAASKGLKIGAVNPNLFQDDEYKLGSLTHPDDKIRKKAIDHIFECISIMENTGATILSLWLADGTNYPGQDDFRARKHRLEDSLGKIYNALSDEMKLLIEYKFFEPAFYHTDIADWGIATSLANKLGDKAKTLVDLGHHPQGTNIEHIVAFLIDENKLGGFHFNSRKYADDDLTAGSINPYELFLIYKEIAAAEEEGLDIAYMIDESHNIKPTIQATIQSVLNIQEAYAKALFIDRKALTEAQVKGDIVQAEEILLDAYRQDVRPLLKIVRDEIGCPQEPLKAYIESGYYERISEERAK